MNELIASNHMEIIGAATVSETAKVDHLQESPEGSPTIEGLFWRQKYDYAERNALAVGFRFNSQCHMLTPFRNLNAFVFVANFTRLTSF